VAAAVTVSTSSSATSPSFFFISHRVLFDFLLL
jgi:hypothetical protein